MDTHDKIKVGSVGEWLSSCGGEVGCKLCGHALESISHCFWNCTEAMIIQPTLLPVATNSLFLA